MMRLQGKRGLLVWGGSLVGFGLGMLAYGQIGLLREKLRHCTNSERMGEVTSPITGSGPGLIFGAQVPKLPEASRPSGSPGRMPLRSAEAARSIPRRRVTRPRAFSHRLSYRAVMPSRKIRLSHGLKNWLRRQAKRGLPPGWLYVITGYATERSRRSKNLRLARARAKAVRAYLVTHLGVPADRIRIHRSVRVHKKGHVSSKRGVRICVGRGEECL